MDGNNTVQHTQKDLLGTESTKELNSIILFSTFNILSNADAAYVRGITKQQKCENYTETTQLDTQTYNFLKANANGVFVIWQTAE